MIEFKNVNKKYGQFVALENITVNFEKGKIIGLLGSNGSGKTTIIKLLNGLLTQNSGEILVNDKKIGIESKKVIS